MHVRETQSYAVIGTSRRVLDGYY